MQTCEIKNNVYFIENNCRVKEAEIVTKTGDFYTLRFDGHKGIRLRAGRLFPTYEQAEHNIKSCAIQMDNLPPLLH